ncbi:GntR family transcriptional regulator [Paracidovorax konjaci]|uniref:DNA-binding transcriptional regulator, GntR family n=1 Tax=Paracidovorax konjaci TaxID=32040 RepID=A0A1I1UNQ2_9BURK|nr:GntR family transcriptional regulator [Paracidovorax konjaci]SFD72482.1 DNA-binding transcriptional regulator, GntR family [Paracidovorax konjaci]
MKRPHYADIARHLTESITTGHFAVGSLLPTELELCAHYGTSRHTIRAALTELQAQGLVSRRKNVGTRVESAQVRSGFRPTLASVDDLVQFSATHIRRVQSVGEVELGVGKARELGCAPGSRWLRISSLRLEADADGGLPVGWTDVYVDPAYEAVGTMVRQEPGTLICALIESRYGRRIAEIRQEIHAATVAGTLAEKLQLAPGAVVLKVIRHYFDADGVAFEMSVSVHPAERFWVSMRLRQSDPLPS